MIRKFSAYAILLAALAAPAMAQPAIQITAPLGQSGFISVGAGGYNYPAYPAYPMVQPVYQPVYQPMIQPIPVVGYNYYRNRNYHRSYNYNHRRVVPVRHTPQRYR